MVLAPGRDALRGRREPLGVPVTGPRAAALERTGRKNVAADGRAQRRYVRTRWQRDAARGPVCGFTCVEVLLPALPIRPGQRVNKFYMGAQNHLAHHLSQCSTDSRGMRGAGL